MAASSGTTLFQPAISDLIIEAYSRIQISGPALTTEHIIDARRSLNIILSDWSANRNVLLWAVDNQTIATIPGTAQYALPTDTVQILDVYVRTYQPNTVYTTIGAALTPMVMIPGQPMVTQFGDPVTTTPGSGALTCTAGSQIVTLNWPSHGLSAGAPIFFLGIMSVGGLSLSGMLAVNTVIDSNNVTVIAPSAALETQVGQGAPPLFTTTSGSASVSVIYPNHGLTAGATFNVPISTTGGGVTLLGNYTVATVVNSYTFTIASTTNATSTLSFFQNGGKFQVTSQMPGVDIIDIIMGPLSRTDYASFPDKQSTGRPTVFWFDRLQSPSLFIWQVPPPVSQSAAYAITYYRMRSIQDAVPVGGQTLDMPNRALAALTAALTAAVAEKHKPEMHQQKLVLAEALFDRFGKEETEHAPLYIFGDMSVYYL